MSSDPTDSVNEAQAFPPGLNDVLRSRTLGDLVHQIQLYTKKWPEPLRYPRNYQIGATDSDGGFERLLRESLDDAMLPGQVSGTRDMEMGDGRTPGVVPRHELDLILRCNEGRFVIEAKAWQGEVGKEAVIVFLAKMLDFMAAVNVEPLGPIFAGFIGLNGFSDAALRIMFTCGVIPFTKRPEQLAFRYVDALARGAASHSQKHGWSDLERSLREHRTALTPYLAQEGKDMSRTFLFDLDSAVVDLESIRRASEMV